MCVVCVPFPIQITEEQGCECVQPPPRSNNIILHLPINLIGLKRQALTGEKLAPGDRLKVNTTRC